MKRRLRKRRATLIVALMPSLSVRVLPFANPRIHSSHYTEAPGES